MKLTFNPAALASTIAGELQIPGDKSISHRALMIGSLSAGTSVFTNLLSSADITATKRMLERLGVKVTHDGDTVLVHGKGLANYQEPDEVLDMGNSGTTTRLGLGLIGPSNIFAVFSGDPSLQLRPMDRIIKPLSALGLRCYARANNTRSPIVTLPPAEPRAATVTGTVPSAQVKSAFVLAAAQIPGESQYIEPVLTRNHTELMLAAAGADIVTDGPSIRIKGGRPLNQLEMQIPGDPSSAAFWTVAGLIHPHSRLTLRNVGINPRRCGFLSVLRRMGGRIEVVNRRRWGLEEVADLEVCSSSLVGCEITAAEIPDLIDEIPIISVAAAVATGTTRITGAGELRFKESDRISTIVCEYSKLGVQASELPDGLEIFGSQHIRGGTVDSRRDHRIAMSTLILALSAGQPVTVDGAETISTSYPDFEATFRTLYGLDSMQKICE